MEMLVPFLILILLNLTHAKDQNTVQFIKKYIENEENPVNLILDNLCWERYKQVKLMNEMVKIGVKSAPIFKHSKYLNHNVLFLIDLDCPNSQELILNATTRKLFASPFRWLVLSAGNSSSAVELLMSSPIMCDSDLVVAEKMVNDIKLIELHKPSVNHSMIITPRGNYNGSLRDVRPHRELFRRRRDLMGHYLTLSNVIQDSNASKYHIEQEDRLELQHDSLAKITYTAAKDVFDILNATRRQIYSYRYGYKENGQWSGMIEDILHNKADVGPNCALIIERLEVITYTGTVSTQRARFLFRQPPLTYVTNVFSLPFSKDVWIAIVVCSIACAVTLTATSRWEIKLEKNPTQLDGSVGDALLLTMSAVTQQGCCVEPRRAPGRILEWVFFACLMALYAAYTANIVVLLQAPSNSIKTLAQLLSSGIHLAANDVDYNHFLLSPSHTVQDSLHQAVHDRIISKSGKEEMYNIYEGVEKMRKGLFAFHSIVEPVYHRVEETFLETEKCDLTEVDILGSFDASTPVKKDSPYLELLKVAYKQVHEVGLLSALNRRLQTQKPRCLSKQVAFTSVGLLDLMPVMLLMVYGTALALAILLMEIAMFKLYSLQDLRVSRMRVPAMNRAQPTRLKTILEYEN